MTSQLVLSLMSRLVLSLTTLTLISFFVMSSYCHDVTGWSMNWSTPAGLEYRMVERTLGGDGPNQEGSNDLRSNQRSGPNQWGSNDLRFNHRYGTNNQSDGSNHRFGPNQNGPAVASLRFTSNPRLAVGTIAEANPGSRTKQQNVRTATTTTTRTTATSNKNYSVTPTTATGSLVLQGSSVPPGSSLVSGSSAQPGSSVLPSSSVQPGSQILSGSSVLPGSSVLRSSSVLSSSSVLPRFSYPSGDDAIHQALVTSTANDDIIKVKYDTDLDLGDVQLSATDRGPDAKDDENHKGERLPVLKMIKLDNKFITSSERLAQDATAEHSRLMLNPMSSTLRVIRRSLVRGVRSLPNRHQEGAHFLLDRHQHETNAMSGSTGAGVYRPGDFAKAMRQHPSGVAHWHAGDEALGNIRTAEHWVGRDETFQDRPISGQKGTQGQERHMSVPSDDKFSIIVKDASEHQDMTGYHGVVSQNTGGETLHLVRRYIEPGSKDSEEFSGVKSNANGMSAPAPLYQSANKLLTYEPVQISLPALGRGTNPGGASLLISGSTGVDASDVRVWIPGHANSQQPPKLSIAHLSDFLKFLSVRVKSETMMKAAPKAAPQSQSTHSVAVPLMSKASTRDFKWPTVSNTEVKSIIDAAIKEAQTDGAGLAVTQQPTAASDDDLDANLQKVVGQMFNKILKIKMDSQEQQRTGRDMSGENWKNEMRLPTLGRPVGSRELAMAHPGRLQGSGRLKLQYNMKQQQGLDHKKQILGLKKVQLLDQGISTNQRMSQRSKDSVDASEIEASGYEILGPEASDSKLSEADKWGGMADVLGEGGSDGSGKEEVSEVKEPVEKRACDIEECRRRRVSATQSGVDPMLLMLGIGR